MGNLTQHIQLVQLMQIFCLGKEQLPNGHTTSNRHGFDEDITSIRRRPNFDEFPSRFHVLFRCNFDGRNIHVDSTYFFDVISMVKKSKLFSRTCFDVISMVEKSTSISRTFFDVISMVEKYKLFSCTCFDLCFPTQVFANENFYDENYF